MPSYNTGLYGNSFPLNTTKTPIDRILARRFRGYQKRAAIMKALNGAVVGGTASLTKKRVQASNPNVTGNKPIETKTVINRATVTADKQLIDNLLFASSRITTPTNKAGKFPA